MYKLFTITLFALLNILHVSAQKLDVGDSAPELRLINADGEEVTLSSLKGQIVFIDFWASWCAPCRRENPKIAELINEYADSEFKNASGFKVYSVSLDQSKRSWLKALEADKLTYPTSVTDLDGFKGSAAKTYNIRRIPTSYLIDSNGEIIAVNINGDQLASRLKKMAKKKSRFF